MMSKVIRYATGMACLMLLAAPVYAFEASLDGSGNGEPADFIVYQTWQYVTCDAMGIDYDADTGLIWVADQGGFEGECPPNGQIFTFDPDTGVFTLEFVTSDVIGFPDVAANGIEVVGDHVYIADFNGDVTNFDDSIYKFTRGGVLVAIYDISYALDTVVGLGYLDGVFYASTINAEVYTFTENEGAGTMDLQNLISIAPGQSGGGGLDWDPDCEVWLHVDFRNVPEEVYVYDVGFNLVGTYPAETTNPIGVTYGLPTDELMPTLYVISRDDILSHKSNDHPDCSQITATENATWGRVKSIYR
jgi:hypothetical protein